MPSEPRLLVDLPAVKAEHAGFDPLAFVLDATDDFGWAHEAQIVEGEPRADGQRGAEHHLADSFDRHRLVAWRTQRARLDTFQVDSRDILQPHCPIPQGFDGDDIVVDRLLGVSRPHHVVLDALQIDGPDHVGTDVAERPAEPGKVLLVVATQVDAALQLLGCQEHGDQLRDGVRFGHRRQPLRVAHSPPSRPFFELLQVELFSFTTISSEVPPASCPVDEVRATNMLLELGWPRVHRIQPTKLGLRAARVVGALAFERWCARYSTKRRNPLQNNDLRHSPSRTRTYNLAVNSRHRLGTSDPVKIGYLVGAHHFVTSVRMVYNGSRMSSYSPRTAVSTFAGGNCHLSPLRPLAPPQGVQGGQGLRG